VTTNVTAKPVIFLPGANHGYTVVSHLCGCNTLTITVQENNLSNIIPQRVKSRTETVKHFSRSLETWKLLEIILSKLNFII